MAMFPLRMFLSIALPLLLADCQSTPSTGKDETVPDAGPGGEQGGVSLSFLLSMDYNEAAAISAQKAEVPPAAKVAADTVEVLRTTPDGKPRRVRAKGHVFVQLDYDQTARALCQEALVGDSELILRGKPVLQRGSSTVEGTSDVTVFYMNSQRLRVIGPHKVTSLKDMLSTGQTPGAWSGPNPLLPPLDSGAVPDAVRDELRRSIEAEMVLQQSRVGVPPAFPEAGTAPLSKPVELKEKDAKGSDGATKPKNRAED